MTLSATLTPMCAVDEHSVMARQADPDYPGPLGAWMAPFAGCFTRPTWANMLILVAGAILSPGRRTVAAALSSVGLRGEVE